MRSDSVRVEVATTAAALALRAAEQGRRVVVLDGPLDDDLGQRAGVELRQQGPARVERRCGVLAHFVLANSRF